MKRNIRDLSLMLGRVEQRHIRFGLAVLTLILFILGAGAPGGDCGG
jgi:multisubunit Na+/H+ antiporter MnhB subunit